MYGRIPKGNDIRSMVMLSVFFSSRRRHTRFKCDWSSDVCSSDLHSAEEASQAFFSAAQQENERALLDILGPAGKEVISSGDPAEDMDHRVGFVVKYKQMHRLAKESDGKMILYVGAENWPFPIPLASKNGVWFFDTDSGKEETLLLRIGKNKLPAIDACQHLVNSA